ncbi:F-box only protein 40 [Trichoplax sp. H2]|nr:F-box only protein 40 [Trichoplax sp. H2]|eukprot:RDD41825.1 F-box only protein 40 [Trichoplax sp. H2]
MDSIKHEAMIDQHPQCLTCILIDCQHKNHCQMIQCNNSGCNACFHACKLTEHKLLCLYENVQCINWYYGCPQTMPRCRLNQHLTVCPASILHCSKKWSRCPTWCNTGDINPPYVLGQIDYEAALCDQQKLLQFYENSQSIDFENLIKSRFSSSHACWFDDYCKRSNEAIESIIQSRLCVDMIHQIQMLNIEQKGKITIEDETFAKEDLFPLLNNIDALYEIQQKLRFASRSQHDVKANNIFANGRTLKLKDGRLVADAKTSIHLGHEDKSTDGSFMDRTLQVERYKLIQLLPKMVQQLSELLNKSTRLQSKELNHLQKLLSALQLNDSAISPECANEGKLGGPRYSDFTVNRVQHIKNAHWMLNSMKNRGVLLGLHLQPGLHNEEHIFQLSCNQYFRRGEYRQHVKFSHTQTQCELSGWFKQRCPLAQYGCPFLCSVLKPNAGEIGLDLQLGSYILRNYDKESTYWRDSVESKNTRGGTELQYCPMLDLPDEVIERILLLLDSYSMYNLSLTCRQMREMCSLLLVKKGTVAIEWEKAQNCKWQIARKIWKYSTACSQTSGWKIDDTSIIARHLQTCPYYVKQIYPDKRVMLPICTELIG